MENPPRRRRPAQTAQPIEPPVEQPTKQQPLTPQPADAPQRPRRRAQTAAKTQAHVPIPQEAIPARSAPPAAEPPKPPRKGKPKKKKKKRASRKWLILLLILLLLLILIGGGILVYKINQKREFERYQFDTEAMAGRIQMMTEEEIQAELNRVVEEGMFNISIASAIVFESPESEGEARIENVAANNYHMQVDIILDESGETVYSSKLIQPGYSIGNIKLSEKLEPGEYEATAIFSAITKDEMKLFGTAGAQIKLYVLDENGRVPQE